MGGHREIVVGVDGTKSSERALAWAYAEAARRGAPLRAVTTWLWDPGDAVPLGGTPTIDLELVAREIQDGALNPVIKAAEAAVPQQVEVIRQVLRGTPADALIAASKGAELVVVGTHGRGPVRQFLMGSVSQAVIRHAKCPVVVMPPVDHAIQE